MITLKILEPGIFTSIQDLGRFGLHRYGIPASGAMDRLSLRIANLLVGNQENSACLEVTLGGTALEGKRNAIIATTGADLSLRLNDSDMPQWEAVEITRGDKISFTNPRRGCRAYLAVSGGFETPLCLGSRSYYSKSKLGQVESRLVARGLELESSEPANSTEDIVGRRIDRSLIPMISEKPTVDVLLAKEDQDLFPEESFDLLVKSDYLVSTESDRVGYRLIGQRLSHQRTPEILSEPTPPGSIQVPGDGQPIVLMADAPTTGGYPKIGYVATSDLRAIAQLRPGDSLTFRETSVETAIVNLLEQEKNVQRIREQLHAPRTSLGSREVVAVLASLISMTEGKPATISLEGEGGYRLKVTPKTGRERPAKQERQARTVDAPFTGTVTRIYVKQSERIKADQLLATMEALKMQVEVRSPYDGTVQEVRVISGQSIKQGTVMMVIGE